MVYRGDCPILCRKAQGVHRRSSHGLLTESLGAQLCGSQESHRLAERVLRCHPVVEGQNQVRASRETAGRFCFGVKMIETRLAAPEGRYCPSGFIC